MSNNTINSNVLTPAGAIDSNVIYSTSTGLTPAQPAEGEAGAIDNNASSNVVSEKSEEAAAVGTPAAEDTASLDSYRRLTESQGATINELTEKIVSLQAQIAKLVNGGATVTDGQAQAGTSEPVPPMGQQEDYIPLDKMDFSFDKNA